MLCSTSTPGQYGQGAAVEQFNNRVHVANKRWSWEEGVLGYRIIFSSSISNTRQEVPLVRAWQIEHLTTPLAFWKI